MQASVGQYSVQFTEKASFITRTEVGLTKESAEKKFQELTDSGKYEFMSIIGPKSLKDAASVDRAFAATELASSESGHVKRIDISHLEENMSQKFKTEELMKPTRGDYQLYSCITPEKDITLVHPTRVELHDTHKVDALLDMLQSGTPTMSETVNADVLKTIGWTSDETSIDDDQSKVHFKSIGASLDPTSYIDREGKNIHANLLEGMFLAKQHYGEEAYNQIRTAVANYVETGETSETLTAFLKTSVYKEGAHLCTEDELKWAAKNAIQLQSMYPDQLESVSVNEIAQALLDKYMARTVMTEAAPGLVATDISDEGASVVKLERLDGVDMMITGGSACSSRGIHSPDDPFLLTTRALSSVPQDVSLEVTELMLDSVDTSQPKDLGKVYQASEKGFGFGVMKFPVAIPSAMTIGDDLSLDTWKEQETHFPKGKKAFSTYKDSVHLTADPGPIGTRSPASQRVLNYGMEQQFQIKGGGMTTAPHGYGDMTGMEMDEGYHDTDAQWVNQWADDLFSKELAEPTSVSSTVGGYELTGIRTDAECLRIGTVTCRESDSKGLRASIIFEEAVVEDDIDADEMKEELVVERPKASGRSAMFAEMFSSKIGNIQENKPKEEGWKAVYQQLKDDHQDDVPLLKREVKALLGKQEVSDSQLKQDTAKTCLETYAQLRFFGMKFDDTNTGSGEDFSITGKVSDTGGLSKLKESSYLAMLASGTVIQIAEKSPQSFQEIMIEVKKGVSDQLHELGHESEAVKLASLDYHQTERLLKDWAITHGGGREEYQAGGLDAWGEAFSGAVAEFKLK